ncbi:MAG: hypothetical protein KatS3mg126_1154 [Lysobacteraceae bacterium]|nr:MAG: hypothetical protein KatS3mg126_1154 [Xanthomonadaceae bacterium]
MLAEDRDDRVAGQFQQAPREGVALLDQDQPLQLLGRDDGVTADPRAGDGVDLALADVRGEVHLAAVRADRDLRALDVEIDVAAVEVEGVEFLEIAGELLPRVLVVTPIPRQPVGGARLPAFGDLLVAEGLVADDVDVADLGRPPLLDVDGQIDPVAVELGHRGGDGDVVLAAVVVLPHQLLGHALQLQAVEGLALGEADLLQALEQFLGLDVLVADQGDLVDRRTLGDLDHQDAALAVDLHVIEESGPEQGADRFGHARAVDPVAALDRQVGEHRAGRDPLQAVDPDVGHREGFEAADGGWRQGLGHSGGGRAGKCHQDGSGESFHCQFRRENGSWAGASPRGAGYRCRRRGPSVRPGTAGPRTAPPRACAR